MTRSFRAELLKLFTTRAIYGMLAGVVAVVLLTTASTVMSADASALAGPVRAQVAYLLVSINVGLFSLILGMRTMSDDVRHGAIVQAFLADPRRRRTVLAKAVVGALAAAGLAAIAWGLLVAVALPLADVKGGSLALTAGDAGAAAGFLAANALWAVVGVGVAAVVPHQVPAIVGGVVWVLVIENLGSGFLGEAGRYLPGQAAYAAGLALDGDAALPAATAALVLAAYAAVALLAGVGAVRRRDIAA